MIMDRYGNIREYDPKDIKKKKWIKKFLKRDKPDSSINKDNLAYMVYIIRENHKCKKEDLERSNKWIKIIQ